MALLVREIESVVPGVGTDPANLGPVLARLMAGRWKKEAIPQKWDGKAAVRIVAELERLLGSAD